MRRVQAHNTIHPHPPSASWKWWIRPNQEGMFNIHSFILKSSSNMINWDSGCQYLFYSIPFIVINDRVLLDPYHQETRQRVSHWVYLCYKVDWESIFLNEIYLVRYSVKKVRNSLSQESWFNAKGISSITPPCPEKTKYLDNLALVQNCKIRRNLGDQLFQHR